MDRAGPRPIGLGVFPLARAARPRREGRAAHELVHLAAGRRGARACAGACSRFFSGRRGLRPVETTAALHGLRVEPPEDTLWLVGHRARKRRAPRGGGVELLCKRAAAFAGPLLPLGKAQARIKARAARVDERSSLRSAACTSWWPADRSAPERTPRDEAQRSRRRAANSARPPRRSRRVTARP